MVRLLAVVVVVAGLSGCVYRQTSVAKHNPAVQHPMLAEAEAAYMLDRKERAQNLYRSYRLGFAHGEDELECRYWEGLIALELGEPEVARPHLVEAVDAENPALRAKAFAALGDVQFVEGDYRLAARSYQRSLDLHVTEARNDYALYRLGLTRMRLGDWGGGTDHLRLLVKRYPNSMLAPRAQQRLALPVHGFFLTTEAFSERGSAELLAHHVQSQGFPTRLLHNGVAKTPWLVWVGPYSDVDAAQRDAQRLRKVVDSDFQLVP